MAVSTPPASALRMERLSKRFGSTDAVVDLSPTRRPGRWVCRMPRWRCANRGSSRGDQVLLDIDGLVGAAHPRDFSGEDRLADFVGRAATTGEAAPTSCGTARASSSGGAPVRAAPRPVTTVEPWLLEPPGPHVLLASDPTARQPGRKMASSSSISWAAVLGCRKGRCGCTS